MRPAIAPGGQLPRRLARAATIVALVVGGAVAILVPIFFAVVLWGMLSGE